MTLLALLMLLAIGCERTDTPLRIDLAGLVEAASDLDGRRVETTGVLRLHPDPEHAWIEDSRLHRVGVEPTASVRGFIGQTVWVRGRFRLDPEQGRQIRIDAIEPVAAAETPPVGQ